jgi:O-antigen ligase
MPFFPSSETWDGGRLTGVFPVESSNGIATEGAVLGLVALCRLLPLSGKPKDRAWYIFIFLVSVSSMVLTQTRVANVSFICSVGIIMMFVPKLRRAVLMAIAAIIPFLGASILWNPATWKHWLDSFVTYMERNQSQGAFESLSGRTAWWSYGFEQLAHHPLTGIGAYGGRFGVLQKLGVGKAAMMHSDWVEVVVGTSIWGLVPFALCLILTWYYLIRCVRRSEYPVEMRQLALELSACLGFLSLHSFVNDELSWHSPMMYLVAIAYAEYCRRSYKERRLADGFAVTSAWPPLSPGPPPAPAPAAPSPLAEEPKSEVPVT